MFENYAPRPPSRWRSTPLAASLAIHLTLLLIVLQIHFRESLLPRYRATPLYLPVAEPVPALAPQLKKVPVIPFLAPPPSAPSAKLAAPKLLPDLPAWPQPSVSRAPPMFAGQPALRPPLAALPPPASPVFPAASPAVVSPAQTALPRTGLFAGAPVTAPPQAAKLPVASGAFGAVQAAAGPHASSAAATLPAGFGSAAPTAAVPHRQNSVVASNAFGGVAAAVPSKDPPAKPPTAGTAFTAALAADPLRPPVAVRHVASEPLEILSKPRPAYTEEARRARIEGDVVLEVLFTAAGTLRVLRVVRGLGSGLERNAIDAAARIRFHPAQENGKSIDTVATVRISFQLAY